MSDTYTPRQKVTLDMVTKAKNIYVFVTFTSNDESWIKVSKREILHHIRNNAQEMKGDIDRDGDMWISPN